MDVRFPLEKEDSFAYLKKLSHGSSLLLSYGCVLLLNHTKPTDSQLQLNFDLGLWKVSRFLVAYAIRGSRTTRDDEGAILNNYGGL